MRGERAEGAIWKSGCGRRVAGHEALIERCDLQTYQSRHGTSSMDIPRLMSVQLEDKLNITVRPLLMPSNLYIRTNAVEVSTA